MTLNEEPQEELRTSVLRLNRDMVLAATSMTLDEARYLVDAYYVAQEARKRTNNQTLSMDKSKEPHLLLSWLSTQNDTLEGQIRRALDKFTDVRPIGVWLKSLYGIGPVLAAGLIAHIDIEKAPTVGHIWRYAGYDPTSKWEKGTKRPWNADLKTLCWKCGQSFMKFSNAEQCLYGHIYRERKTFEVQRNEAGYNKEAAALTLVTKKINKSKDAYKYLITGVLPPGQIDARARRYAVKIFLAHLQYVWWYLEKGEKPPKPYAISVLGHAHVIQPPNLPEGVPEI
jgi:Transposase IS116/IS110/IS902 family